MATQGPNGGTGSGAGWTGPGNVAATDGIYATASIATVADSTILTSTGFGFSIPAGATINGIQVDIVRHASSIGSLAFDDSLVIGCIGVKMVKAGVGAGTNKLNSTVWNITDATTTLGNSADLWGTTWTPADINASNFGVQCQVENQSAGARTASIDSMLITVTFTPAAGGTSTSQMFKVF